MDARILLVEDDPSIREVTALGGIPFAAFVSDPCDGRTQGTTGMMDSLAYRNDAAIVLRRLIRSLPTRRGVMVTAFGPNPDGAGTILRIWELAGRSVYRLKLRNHRRECACL